jgi:hypothetical protein
VLQQAGRLDHPAQLMLAPATPHLRRPQRRHQLFRLGAQLAGDGAHLPHLLTELGVRVHPLALELDHPLLVAAQRVVQGSDREGHRLLRLGGRLVRQGAHRLLQPLLTIPKGLHGGLEPGDVGRRAQPGGQPAEGGAAARQSSTTASVETVTTGRLPDRYDKNREGTVEI